MKHEYRYVRWFEELTIDDIPIVGGKNASLGDMYRELTPKGIDIPNGFAVTAEGYRYVLSSAGITDKLKEALSGLDTSNVEDLSRRGKKCRELVLNAGIPDDMWEEIKQAYDELCKEYGEETDVAVRSSATAEDLPTASFAGQQETYLNISGYTALREACSKCLASLFTDRAISYRTHRGFDHSEVALSIAVQKMVRADKAASGVIFTLDTETGFRDVVFVTGAYGLGENIVQGTVNPDEFYVFKPTLKKGFKSLIRKKLGQKHIRMVYGTGTSKALTKNVKVPLPERKRYCITDEDVLTLAEYSVAIEEHYTAKKGSYQPMDIEWAKDGDSGKLFILQARPETVQSQKDMEYLETYHLKGSGEKLVTGRSVGEKIGTGKARVIEDVKRLRDFKPGEVLIADNTSPDWEPVMKTAAAIVTNSGGRTCHAAIVSRELGIPAIVGTDDATEKISDGMEVTVDCSSGDEGVVYKGKLEFNVDRISLKDIKKTKTEIMINLGNPDIAFSTSMIPNSGVGLARMEFIVSSFIKIHPMALVRYDKVEDADVRKEIDDLTYGYVKREEYFIEKLSEGVGTIAAAFYPKPVIVRLSDFKTNEYESLIGGKYFEPHEENPMMGFRGASRYYDDRYREGFSLECRAMKRVREHMGLTNLVIMVPFVRRVGEAKQVLEEMEKNGLKRGENGLKIFMMCEIPNNVILIDEFSGLFDGISIGSNDLTQFTLGVDRDSDLVAHDFDERDPGVMKFISDAIKGAKRNGIHSGICGQAPSDYPEVAEFLVREGIDSISLNPDTVIKTTVKIAELEDELGLSE